MKGLERRLGNRRPYLETEAIKSKGDRKPDDWLGLYIPS
jgi:hypothetical protein